MSTIGAPAAAATFVSSAAESSGLATSGSASWWTAPANASAEPGTVRQRDQDGFVAVHVELGQHGGDHRRID